MAIIKKIIQTVRFFLRVRIKASIELLSVIHHYFPYWRFAFSWSWLKACYLLNNPYHCSRQYIAGRPDEEEFLYGETPLTALDAIMSAANVTAEDHVFDLG
ncbi:MAG: hypothetical protein PUP46_03905, partial [Endozoicomonas sp. (ex Botrylloides leachii)]|nr:hypothetical protein [Endozoicomonas sp. (ex Botrylloides leachii)]